LVHICELIYDFVYDLVNTIKINNVCDIVYFCNYLMFCHKKIISDQIVQYVITNFNNYFESYPYEKYDFIRCFILSDNIDKFEYNKKFILFFYRFIIFDDSFNDEENFKYLDIIEKNVKYPRRCLVYVCKLYQYINDKISIARFFINGTHENKKLKKRCYKINYKKFVKEQYYRPNYKLFTSGKSELIFIKRKKLRFMYMKKICVKLVNRLLDKYNIAVRKDIIAKLRKDSIKLLNKRCKQ